MNCAQETVREVPMFSLTAEISGIVIFPALLFFVERRKNKPMEITQTGHSLSDKQLKTPAHLRMCKTRAKTDKKKWPRSGTSGLCAGTLYRHN